MMTEASEKGVCFVCEECGWHSPDRAEAVAHALHHAGIADFERKED